MPYWYYSPIGLIGLAIFVLDIVAIISVVSGHSKVERKVLWTLAILFLPVIGMILYFLMGRNSQDATARV